MIKILKKILLILLTANAFSQAPQLMSYQSVIRNSDGNLITNSTVGMRISILQGSINGNPVFVETQTPTSNANGLVSLKIGNGALVSGSIAQIDWSNGEYYVKTEADPSGGTSYSINGTTQLLSVPYALYANSSNNYTRSSSGVFSRPFDSASSIQLIPHGLGAIPSKVKITAKWMPGNFGIIISSDSIGVFEQNTSTTSTLWNLTKSDLSVNNISTTDIVSIYDFDGNALTAGQTATIAVDSTNIILTWTYQGDFPTSNSSPVQVLWEATK
jgi:hypothetical protein